MSIKSFLLNATVSPNRSNINLRKLFHFFRLSKTLILIYEKAKQMRKFKLSCNSMRKRGRVNLNRVHCYLLEKLSENDYTYFLKNISTTELR